MTPADISAVTHEVRATNLSAAAENKIHDDAVARTYGFTGALVPGVEVYAYMAHAPVARWGGAWLESGTAECRFVSPVYEGDEARVSAVVSGDGLALSVHVGDRLCATGIASIVPPAVVPVTLDVPYRAPPGKDYRPPASETSLAVGSILCVAPVRLTADDVESYLAGIGETDPRYRLECLVHPGQILRLANRALVDNVVLGPWVHVGSRILHHGLAHIGETLALSARINGNDVRKGHAFVEFDAFVTADGRPVASITHTAIWRLRS